MPLDGFGFDAKRALIVAADVVGTCRFEGNIFAEWIAGAHELFARKHNILPQQICFLSASEITSGHLKGYENRTLLLGCEDKVETSLGIRDANYTHTRQMDVLARTSRGIGPLGRFRFPQAIDDVARNGNIFDASLLIHYEAYPAYGCFEAMRPSQSANKLFVTGDGMYGNPSAGPSG